MHIVLGIPFCTVAIIIHYSTYEFFYILKTVTFEKKSSDSYLRLKWVGDVETYNLDPSSGATTKLIFTFNNEECASPGKLTSSITSSTSSITNRYCKPTSGKVVRSSHQSPVSSLYQYPLLGITFRVTLP